MQPAATATCQGCPSAIAASAITANVVPAHAGLVVVRLESPTPVRTPGMLWSPTAREVASTRAFSAIVRKLAFRSSLLEDAQQKRV